MTGEGYGRFLKHIAEPPAAGPPWTHTFTHPELDEDDPCTRLGAATRTLVREVLRPFERLARRISGWRL